MYGKKKQGMGFGAERTPGVGFGQNGVFVDPFHHAHFDAASIAAADQVLGRLATKAATILSGKHRPQYAPFLVSGNHVIIINAEKVKLTGEKLDKKVYRWHTLYPGGLREVAARKVFETKPDRLIREAVLGMLPKNKLGTKMLSQLKVYAGPEHPHQAQNPKKLDVNA